MAKQTDDKAKGVQCLDRALDILEALSQAGELGVSELAQKLGLHVATVHNLLRTLTARGYLMNNGGRYRLGPALGALLSDWSAKLSLPRLLDPLVRELADQTGESSVATVLAGFKAEMIVQVLGRNDVTTHFPQRVFDCPLQLSTGRVLVACGPEALWEEFIRRHAAGNRELRMTTEQWRNELASVRRRRTCSQMRVGATTSSVGALVVGPGDVPAVAIGVSCPSFRASDACLESLLKATLATCEHASQLIGGTLRTK